jgi:hypothetical protein
MNIYQKYKKIINSFVLVAFLLLPLTLFAAEHETKKEPESGPEEHKESSKESASAGEHGEKKPAEKEKKPSKDEMQETLLNPNRVRIQELNFSRFGANDRVVGIISLFLYIEFVDEEIAKKAFATMPRLRSELIAKLTEYVSNNSKGIQDKGFKVVIKKIAEKIYGQKTVKDITIFKAFERKL